MSQYHSYIYPKHWYLLTLIGFLLILAGLAGIYSPWYTTLAVTLVIGWLLLVGGVIETIYAFTAWKIGGFLTHLLLGIFCMLFGILVLTNPAAAAISFTLLLGAYFLSLGLFRIFASLTMKFEHWSWFLAVGIVDLILGFLILLHWPSTGLWVIGLFVGIDFLLTGIAFVATSFWIKDYGKTATTTEGFSSR